MTCREKLKIEHPDKVSDSELGGCYDCPSAYGYLPDPEYCGDDCDFSHCTKCWDREIPKTDKPRILDSGERRQFYDADGNPMAVRDIQEGKGRCDLMPLDIIHAMYRAKTDRCTEAIRHISKFTQTGISDHLMDALEHFLLDDKPWDCNWSTMFLEVAKHFEEGAKKYGEHNWQKGIPTHCYVDSAVRHYLKYLRGDTDEPHDRAFVWNILCCIWTCVYKPELNDYRRDKPFVQNNNKREE